MQKPYLTRSEFDQFGFELKNPNDFDKLLNNASILINQICSYYDPAFAYHDLDADASTPKAIAFKKAVALEMLFLEESGYSSAYELAQGALNSFTVGHTSMSLNGSAGQKMTVGNTGVVVSAYTLLGCYGLLFKGVTSL